MESVLPQHDDLPKLVAGLEETLGTKQEEAYWKEFLSRARSSLPAFSTEPAEQGFSERCGHAIAIESPVHVLDYHENVKKYVAERDSGGKKAEDLVG